MSKQQDESPVRIDESVSRAYREIADERTPGHLDRAVLGKAARAARPGYARSRAWTRPLAWAATIVLSVAIVLELSRVPAPEDAASWEDPASLDEASILAEPDSPTRGDSDSPAAGRMTDLIPDTREKSSPVQKTSAPVTIDAMEAAPRREAIAPESGPAPAAAEVGATPSGTDAARCPPEATRQPSTWLACIERLERAGHVDEASEERQNLREAFPGFELP